MTIKTHGKQPRLPTAVLNEKTDEWRQPLEEINYIRVLLLIQSYIK